MDEDAASKDKEHHELIASVKKFSEEIDKKYDEKIALVTINKDEDDNPTIAKLNEAYLEIKDKISAARKVGKDVFIAENLLKSFPPKLAMAKATLERDDIKKADAVLNDAKKELKESLERKEIDFRAEIEGFSTRSKEGRSEKELAEQEINKELEKIGKIELNPVVEDREIRRKFRYFRSNENKEYKTMAELVEGLRSMTEKTFKYHTEGKYNDFSKWVKEVFEKDELADSIEHIKNKEEMADIIEKAIK